MDIDKIEEIFDKTPVVRGQGDSNLIGLTIISKYCNNVIVDTNHHVVFSEDVHVLIEKGITEDDIRSIASLPGWHYNDEYQCLAILV